MEMHRGLWQLEEELLIKGFRGSVVSIDREWDQGTRVGSKEVNEEKETDDCKIYKHEGSLD